MHVKGYAAVETKAAAERARLLIEQAEALGEPTEDPLLLFSVLYGFWVINFLRLTVTLSARLQRSLWLSPRSKSGSPAYGRASPHGLILSVYGRHRGGASASASRPCAL